MTQTFELKVKSLAGSACSSDGERILVGLNAERSGTLNLTLSPFQALSLITLLSSATSEAAGIRADDPSLKHAFSVAGIEIDRSQSGRFLRLSWKLLDGPEMTFQLDRDSAQRMHALLGSTLSEALRCAVPANDRH